MRLLLASIGILFSSSAFTQEVPSNVTAAIRAADAGIAKIIDLPDGQRTFDNTIGAIDAISTDVDRETSLAIFLQNVSEDAAVRDAARAAQEAVSNWYIELGKNERLFGAIKAYAATQPQLVGEQARLLAFLIRDFKRSGVDLAPEKRMRLKQIETELNKLAVQFEQNIAEDATTVPLTKAELVGVPKDVVDVQTASAGLVFFGLDGPSYGALMDNCEVDSTRQKVWASYRRRAGKNLDVLKQLLKLRAEQAAILGYKNSVDYTVETRMAKNSQSIAAFYKSLEPILRKKAEQDKAEFVAQKRARLHDKKATLMPWDYAFYKNRLLKKKYAIDGDKVSEYFPMGQVVDGLFGVAQSLFGIKLSDVTARAQQLNLPIWNKDVKLYEVADKASGKVLGHMYTDLYPRPNKYNHAACWGLRSHRINEDGTVQLPLVALVCNFTKPTANKPSLLPHDEVETFFHEFGHGLHNLFSEATYGRFAGTSVSLDFVEAPSQMLENWTWNPDVLKLFAKHYRTGKPIPESLVKALRSAQTLGSGIETQGQLYLGEMDQAFHTAKGGEIDTTKVANQVYERTTIYHSVPGTFFEAGFGHLVGYDSAYYGYLWSLVFAQDMFSRFEAKGVLSSEAGLYYRKKVLARGGSVDETEMLRDYLGRDPKVDAFYKFLGLKGGN